MTFSSISSDTHTVYQYHGCFFHGCPECKPHDRDEKKNNWPSLNERYKRTQKTTKKIVDAGYQVIEKWECEWVKEKKQLLQQPVNPYLYPFEKLFRLSETEILEYIKSGELFGAIQCDIHVPEDINTNFLK